MTKGMSLNSRTIDQRQKALELEETGSSGSKLNNIRGFKSTSCLIDSKLLKIRIAL